MSGNERDGPIAFNRPEITGRELRYISDAITSSGIGSDGKYTRACSELLEQRLGLHRVMLTTSCTSALEMAAILCGLRPGDEVIMPSFTFVSTASAFVRVGAVPIFVDIREDTLNIDASLIEAAITPRTKAIVPVHYAGVGCDMDQIMTVAQDHGLRVVEDAAQAVHAYHKGEALGGIGDLGCFSFHETKNYVCGEGGALCINDEALVERAEIIREKGTNRRQFMRGHVDKYTWVDVGSSYVPSELNSAFLLAQLEELDSFREKRRAVYEHYRSRLAPLQEQGCIQLPTIPNECASNYHNFWIVLGTRAIRDDLLAHLNTAGISAVFHYVPLHNSPMGARLVDPVSLPVTEDLSYRMLRLPFHNTLTGDEIDRVADTIELYYRR
jgi:dTDP-4-amino-4,6-dideoxygalactose transaminase